MLRLVLTFLAGALVGANLVYFAMTRERGATAAGALRAPTATTSIPPPRQQDAAMIEDDARAAPLVEVTPSAPRAPAADLPATVAAPVRAGAAVTTIPTGAALAMPLPNLRPAQLQDTYDDPRGASRQHEALDIMAPAGTPVLAVADGVVEKLFTSDQGGLTLYQFDQQGQYAYYYAHLLGYAAGLAEKQPVKRGQVIGYVGSTGNANPAAPHLHFAVFVLGPEKQWWKGTPINPYPLLGGRPAVPGAPPGQ